MKITPQKKVVQIFSISIFFAALSNSSNSLAWDGIDPKNNSSIQIEAGNLVREGSIIDFYDSFDGSYHTGKILIMNSASHATELTIEDFNNKHKERFFLMND